MTTEKRDILDWAGEVPPGAKSGDTFYYWKNGVVVGTKTVFSLPLVTSRARELSGGEEKTPFDGKLFAELLRREMEKEDKK